MRASNDYESPIKKGDFLTMSDLQEKIAQIPEEETISQNTSHVGTNLSYSQSHYDRSMMFGSQRLGMGSIEEVNESQNSLAMGHLDSYIDKMQKYNLSRMQDEVDQLTTLNQNKDAEILQLKAQLVQEKQQLSEQQVEMAIMIEKLQYDLQKHQQQQPVNSEQSTECSAIHQYEQQIKQLQTIIADQHHIITKQEQQNNELKQQSQPKLQRIIDEQSEQIKKLHRLISSNKDNYAVDQIRLKWTEMHAKSKEIKKIYRQLEQSQLVTPKKNINRESSQTSLHNYSTEQKHK